MAEDAFWHFDLYRYSYIEAWLKVTRTDFRFFRIFADVCSRNDVIRKTVSVPMDAFISRSIIFPVRESYCDSVSCFDRPLYKCSMKEINGIPTHRELMQPECQA